MAPPLSVFPSAKPPPPPPWLHGPQAPKPTPNPAPPKPPYPKTPTQTPPNPRPPRNPAPSTLLTAGVPGGRTRRALLSVVRRVRSLQLHHPPNPNPGSSVSAPFHLPLERQEVEVKGEAMPWAAAGDEKVRAALRRERRVRPPTRAEREMDTVELERLRQAARGVAGRWVRAKKAGVTAEVVEAVRGEWRRSEVAAVRLVEPLRRCMDRAREILEVKTGGLVVWTKGDIHFIYRGSNCLENTKRPASFVAEVQKVSPIKSNIVTSQGKYGANNGLLTNVNDGETFQENSQNMDMDKDEESVKGTLYEREVYRLLDGLGPRFIDWWWNTPLPVDADLLSEVVPGFKTPFRQCPPGVRLTLADEELTYLRKLARSLPTHFALGRNTKLQGLAAAILKLWEKSLIAKIAVKVGIQNTNNEQMAWELKLHLLGLTLKLIGAASYRRNCHIEKQGFYYSI